MFLSAFRKGFCKGSIGVVWRSGFRVEEITAPNAFKAFL